MKVLKMISQKTRHYLPRILLILIWITCFKANVDSMELTNNLPVNNSASSSSSPSIWNNVVCDSSTGFIYASQTNILYMLDSDLVIKNSVVTKESNTTRCSTITGIYDKCDNFNKILLVDPVASQLIVCGSTNSGSCELRNLNNLNIIESSDASKVVCNVDDNIENKVVATVVNAVGVASTVRAIFIGNFNVNGKEKFDKFIDGIYRKSFGIDNRINSSNSDDWTLSEGLYNRVINPTTGYSFVFSFVEIIEFEGFIFVFKNLNRDFGRITRICEADSNYFSSYIEMSIQCNNGAKDLKYLKAVSLFNNTIDLAKNNHLPVGTYFVGVFSSSSNDSVSSFCYFDVDKINSVMTNYKNVACQSDDDYTENKYANNVCTRPEKTIPNINCGVSSNLTRQIGNESISSNVFLTLSYNVTNIIVTSSSNDQTVFFVGTSYGNVVKIHLMDISNNDKYRQISSISVDKSSNPNVYQMSLKSDLKYIYVRTKNQISKISTSSCHQYSTCQECLSTLDPYCGWCILDNKCGTYSSCNYLNGWIQPDYTSNINNSITLCPSFSSNDYIESAANIQFQVNLKNIPLSLQQLLICDFDGKTELQPIIINNSNEFYCPIPSGTTYNDVLLSLKKSNNQSITLWSQMQHFYRCVDIKSCTNCTDIKKKCWFNRDTFSCQNTAPQSFIQNCPTITPIVRKINSVTTINLPFTVNNPTELANKQLMCSINGVLFTVSNYTCQAYKFQTDRNVMNVTVKVMVTNPSYFLDGEITIEVYNCAILAMDDCNLCMYHKYSNGYSSCSWCSINNMKVCSSDCTSSSLSTCTSSIDKVSPLEGPLEGGTVINIVGSSIGYNSNQITAKLGGKNLDCTFNSTKLYTCKTGINNMAGIYPLLITTINNNNIVSSYTFNYTYRDVKISATAIFPNYGPVSGGTSVTIVGQNLMSQLNDVHVSSRCNNADTDNYITEWTSNRIVLNTANCSVGKTNITLRIDSFNTTIYDAFEYMNNPDLYLMNAGYLFRSQSCMRSVQGQNLNVSYSRYLTLESSYTCHAQAYVNVVNSSYGYVNLTDIPTQCEKARLTFHFDGWSTTRDVTILDDPIFSLDASEQSYLSVKSNLDDGIFAMRNSENKTTLTIKGVNGTFYDSPIEITRGGSPCSKLSLTQGNIICQLEDATSAGGGGDVVVYLCGRMTKLSNLPKTAWQIPFGICIGIVLLILVITVVVLLVKYLKSKKQYKRLMRELDVMETEARNKYREAFAELQTSEHSIIPRVSNIGVPYHPYKVYAFRILQQQSTDHPILNTNSRSITYDKRDQNLQQLLNYKFFIIPFIRVMESKTDIVEKSRIGSLLSFLLLNKLDYSIQIIEKLLQERVDNYKKIENAKLIFRSGESIVERLTACWLSVSMYRHLKGEVGERLFELYLAVKQQIYSGPVDACTDQAKYTLSERFFIREYSFNDKTLIVNVSEDDRSNPVNCKLLSCDTITQAKDKIVDKLYENEKYSSRPNYREYDLYLVTSQNSDLKLQDENDKMATNSDGYVKLNTLFDYKVKNGDFLKLVMKTGDFEADVQYVGNDEIGIVGRDERVMIRTDHKRWHLTKTDDLGNKRESTRKVMTEVYYPLLQTKVNLEEHINRLFSSIFDPNAEIPPSVKYLFDIFDNIASGAGITDPQVTNIWKNYCFILKFWVNIIQNPNFLINIEKNTVVESCLTVIGQALMDGCSVQEIKLTKDSPTSKLLFAKDHPKFKEQCRDFYEAVRSQRTISSREMNVTMEKNYSRDINMNTDLNLKIALADLFQYATKYRAEITVALGNEKEAEHLRLADKFNQLFNSLS